MLQHDGHGPLSGLRRRVLLDAVPQRGAQAGAEAPSPAVGGLLQPGDHQAGRPAGHGGAHLLVRRPAGRGRVGAGLLPDPGDRVRAHRSRDQPQHCHGHRAVGAPGRHRGPPPGPGRLPVLRLRARPPLHLRPAQAGPHRHLGRLPEGQAHDRGPGTTERHRHSRAGPGPPSRLRRGRRRPGGVHPAGRQQPPRPHLRDSRTVRGRRHGRVRRGRAGAGPGQAGPSGPGAGCGHGPQGADAGSSQR